MLNENLVYCFQSNSSTDIIDLTSRGHSINTLGLANFSFQDIYNHQPDIIFIHYERGQFNEKDFIRNGQILETLSKNLIISKVLLFN